MAPRKTVSNITAATAKATAFAPHKVVLRDKTEVHVGRFHFVHFMPLWNAVQSIAGEVIAASGPQGFDIAGILAGGLRDAPELALRLAAYSTRPKLLNSPDPDGPQELSDYIDSLQTDWDFMDIFKVATAAINVNFGNGEGGEIMDFFTAATDAFKGRAEVQQGPKHPTRPQKQADLQKLNLLVPPPATDGFQA